MGYREICDVRHTRIELVHICMHSLLYSSNVSMFAFKYDHVTDYSLYTLFFASHSISQHHRAITGKITVYVVSTAVFCAHAWIVTFEMAASAVITTYLTL